MAHQHTLAYVCSRTNAVSPTLRIQKVTSDAVLRKKNLQLLDLETERAQQHLQLVPSTSPPIFRRDAPRFGKHKVPRVGAARRLTRTTRARLQGLAAFFSRRQKTQGSIDGSLERDRLRVSRTTFCARARTRETYARGISPRRRSLRHADGAALLCIEELEGFLQLGCVASRSLHGWVTSRVSNTALARLLFVAKFLRTLSGGENERRASRVAPSSRPVSRSSRCRVRRTIRRSARSGQGLAAFRILF